MRGHRALAYRMLVNPAAVCTSFGNNEEGLADELTSTESPPDQLIQSLSRVMRSPCC
jgi:hypothetical protein